MATSLLVVCTNVGTLIKGMIYHIGVRMAFPYSAPVAPSNLPPPLDKTKFGCLRVDTYNPVLKAYDSTPLIPEGCDTTPNYKTLNNLILAGQTVANGFTLVHS